MIGLWATDIMETAVGAISSLLRTDTLLKAMRDGVRCSAMGRCAEWCWSFSATELIESGIPDTKLSQYKQRTMNAPRNNMKPLDSKDLACGWSLCMSS